MSKKEKPTFSDVLKAFSSEDKKQFSELDKQIKAGVSSTVKSGEAMLAMQKMLVKVGVKGGFSLYLREKKIVRQTAYNHIGEYKWSVMPAEFKALAGEKTDDATLRNIQIKECDKATPSVENAAAEVNKYLAEAPEEPEADPIMEAVQHAAKILVAAFKGNLDTVATLAAGKTTSGYAQTELDETGTSLNEAVGKVAQSAFDAISKIVTENKTLKDKHLRLPAVTVLAMAEKQPGPKQIPADN